MLLSLGCVLFHTGNNPSKMHFGGLGDASAYKVLDMYTQGPWVWALGPILDI